MARITLDVIGRDSGVGALLSKLSGNSRKAAEDVNRLSAATDRQAAAELKLRAASVKAQQTEHALGEARARLAKITKDGNSTEAMRQKATLAVESAEVRHAQSLQNVAQAERRRLAVVRQGTSATRAAVHEEEGLVRSHERVSSSGSRMGRVFGTIRAGATGVRTSVGLAATGVGAFATVLAGLAITAVGMGLKTASGMEQAQIGFTTMLGSGTKARNFLSQLQKFAAATPFEFPQLVSASQRLLAMGINAKNVVPYMRAIGDAVAGLGGGPELIDQVTTAIGQMSAKGKIQSDELLQLAEAGIPALKILASAYGVSTSKMQDMVTKGKVLSDDALPKLIKGLETGTKSTQGFGGMMEKQSHSMAGLWSTLKDNVNMSLANMVTPAMPAIKKALAGLITWTGANGPKLGAFVTASVVPKLNELISWFQAHKTDIASWFLSAYASAAQFGAGLLRIVADAVGGFNGLLSGVGFVLGHIMDQVAKFLDGFSGLPVVGGKFKSAAESVRKYKNETDASLKSAQAQGRGIQSAARTAADAMERSAVKASRLADSIRKVPSKHTTQVSAPGAEGAAAKMNAATRAANGIPPRKTTVVQVISRGVGGVQREINSITGHVVAIQVGLVRGVGVRGFARGTSSAPAGIALVGERGPELVNFRGGEQVVPADPTQKMLGGSGSSRLSSVKPAPVLLQPIQLVVDGKVLREVLLKVKRDQGGLSLGLA